MPIDLNNLPDETLFLANDEFYEFIETCLGIDEMLLFKIQSIKNVRALLNVPDVLAVLNVQCNELVDLRKRICFFDENNNNQFFVKSGIKGGIDDLLAALKEKTTEYIKRIKRLKTSSRSSNKNHPSTLNLLSNQSNLNSSNSTLVRTTSNSALNAHSIDLTLTSSIATRTLTSDSGDSTVVTTTNIAMTSLGSIDSTPTPLTTTTASHSMAIKDYVELISASIEKFSLNTFTNITLQNEQDYTISLTFLDKDIEGYVKCKCNSLIKINYRSRTDSFQLSSYFKHLKNSQCFMMKKKRQQSNADSNEMNNLSIDFSRNPDHDTEEDFNDNNSTNHNDSFQTETNHSVSQNSSVARKKRSLPHSTSSIIAKKSRTG